MTENSNEVLGQAQSAESRRGRPPANIFAEHRRRRGEHIPHAPNLDLRHVIVREKHRMLRGAYPKRVRSVTLSHCPEQAERAKHIEFAQILVGQVPLLPEDPDENLRRKERFDLEMMNFHRRLRKDMPNSYERARGKRPDPEVVFRTALCAHVARVLIQPKGGNWRVIPTPRHISQVWYVIFKENEGHKAIEKRLPMVVKWARNYCATRMPYDRQVGYPDKLGRAFERKYPIKKRSRGRGASVLVEGSDLRNERATEDARLQTH